MEDLLVSISASELWHLGLGKTAGGESDGCMENVAGSLHNIICYILGLVKLNIDIINEQAGAELCQALNPSHNYFRRFSALNTYLGAFYIL